MTRSVTAAGTTNYVYAGDGMRVSKTTGSNVTQFAWDSRSSVPELIRDGDDFYVYGPGGLPVERIGANPKRFVMVDGTGSVTMSTDSSGAVASSRSFDVWGNETAHTGTPVSLGWQSQYQDVESGFFYLRNRYYDPVTGQFTTPDALFSLTGDRYGYAGDDPLNHTDPLGLFGYGTIASNFSGITGGLGPLLNNIDNSIGDHQDGILTGIGIALGVASVATGFGLLFGVGAPLAMTLASVGSGVGAAMIDQGPCARGDHDACVTRNVGFAGAALGLAPLPILPGLVTEDSLLGGVLIGAGGVGLGLGQAALFTDVGSAINRAINNN